MNKQFQGSKKKARKKLFLQRQARRNEAKKKHLEYIEALNSGDIEQMADVMGVRLK